MTKTKIFLDGLNSRIEITGEITKLDKTIEITQFEQ